MKCGIAGWLRDNPEADKSSLLAAIQDANIPDPAEIEAIEDRDIAFLIDAMGNLGDYRKRYLRKLAVEPFLRLLEEHEVIPSRDLPLNRMTHALFDRLGIEPKLRLTDAGIRTIARDLRRKS